MSFKICLVGCGHMSKKGHGPSCRKYAGLHQDVKLAACCDRDESKALFYQEKFGFEKYYTDLWRMLEEENPDVVCLIVPVTATKNLAVQILEKGYPVIMEKPPGLNKEETLEIFDAAERNAIPARVAFNRRYMPLIRELKRQLVGNFLPEGIQNITYNFIRSGRRDEDFSTTSIHGIDTVKFLAASDYKYIRFDYQEFPALGPNVANIYMHCEFFSGAKAQLNFLPVGGVMVERAIVNALDHTFFLDLPVWGAMDSPGRLIKVVSKQVILDITGNEISDGDEMFETNGFFAENAAFFDDLRSGRKILHDIGSALQSVDIANCIRNRQKEYFGGHQY